jgi:hypothetical protein
MGHGSGAGRWRGGVDDGITPPKKGRGRPPNPVTRLRREAQDEFDRRLVQDVDALYQRTYALAMGDGEQAVQALKMLVDRLSPQKARGLTRVDLPATKGAVEVGQAMDAVLAQVAAGELPMEDGQRMIGMLESRLKAYEAAELPARVEELEKVARAVQARSAGFPALEGMEGRA